MMTFADLSAKLARKADELNQKANAHLKEIAEDGAAYARTVFNTALDASVNDIHPTTVTVKRTNDGYSIEATGHDVMFVEFGAGQLTDTRHPFSDSMQFPVEKGSYSQMVGTGQFLQGKHEFWYYTKKDGTTHRFLGIEPQRPMYNMTRRIRQRLNQRKEWANIV